MKPWAFAVGTHAPADAGRTQSDSATPALGWATLLSAAVPWMLYLVTASPGSYWLDAGEFVEASVELDIAHPPGHPLTALWGAAWSLLPLGALPFRLALGQALAAALATALLFRACLWTVRSLGAALGNAEVPLALLGAWAWALGAGVWFQAVRPEVYALQALTSLFALERLARLLLGVPHDARARDPRPLYAAALATGLGLTNHHVMAGFTLPALLGCALWVARVHRVRPLLRSALFGSIGLSVYIYLPLRALSDPPANFGDPRTFSNFAWVVSARVYAKSIGNAVQPALERVADLTLVLIEHFHVLLPLALLGAYAASRSRGGARAAALWCGVAASAFGLKLAMGFERNNPDSVAYVMAGLAGVAALASAGAASLLGAARRWPRGVVGAAWAAALLVPASAAAWTRAQCDLGAFHGTDGFDEQRLRRVPPRSAIVATTPQTVFRQLELQASERIRPDVVLLPLPFLNYPGVAAALVRAHPELAPIVQGMQRAERIDPEALAGVARQRPVLLELDPHTPSSAYAALSPRGPLYAWVGAPQAARDLPHAAVAQREAYLRIAADLGGALHETETARQWLYAHFFDALYYAQRAAPTPALQALAAARALFPQEAALQRLESEIARSGGAPIDVRGYLPTPAAQN